jgi:hypothetical protein
LLRRPYTRPGCGKRENRKRISTLAATTCPDPPDASVLHRPKPQPARGDALGILLSFGLRCSSQTLCPAHAQGAIFRSTMDFARLIRSGSVSKFNRHARREPFGGEIILAALPIMCNPPEIFFW